VHRSRVISVVASWLFLVPAASAGTDYGPLTLFQLLATSEIAVRGEVGSVEEAHYELEVTEIYRPAELPATLGVVRFDTYPPETRSGNVARGQTVVLFAESAGDGLARPLGAAGEGEILREEGYVYVRAMARPPEMLSLVQVPGQSYTAYRIDAAIFDSAVEGFYACFQPSGSTKIARLCSDEAMESYRNGSWLAEHLTGIAVRLITGGD
jgi:hypothetical protein